jgi:hypothetical protein
MRRRRVSVGTWMVPWIAAAALGAGIACSSESRPPAESSTPGDSGSIADGGGHPGMPGEAGAAESGPEASVEGGAGEGGASEGGASGNEGGDAAEETTPVPPECSQTDPWANLATVASVPSAGFARFGGISADERTVAWTDSTGAIFVADRATGTASFAAATSVFTGGQALANDRVAVDPTGTELIATVADQSSFTSFLRGGQGQAWQPGNADPFATLAATIAESGGAFSEPVLSADGLSLFYLLVIGTNLPVLYESSWDSGTKTWELGTPLSGPDFVIGSASQLRRPTGAASDRLTLFFFDEVAGNERAAWRETPASAFDFFVDLPNAPEAAPDEDCVTLYFQASSGAGASNLSTAQ